MVAVKGSKPVRMVVVPYRPWRKLCVALVVVLLLMGGVSSAYLLAHRQAIQDLGDAIAEREQLEQAVARQRQEIQDLRQSLVNSEQASAVDRQALEDLQGTIVALRERSARLEEDVAYYRQILDPEEQGGGLAIGRLDLIALAEPGRYRYLVEITRMDSGDERIEGGLTVEVVGSTAGEEASYPLQALAVGELPDDIRLGFRYFQNVEGELALPEGFVPSSIKVVATVADTGRVVEKNFEWSLGS